MTIEFLAGTPGSGKSYHALEKIVEWLAKGKHVIANFPLKFTPKMVRDGWSERFMYIPDDFLLGENGMALLWKISSEKLSDGIARFYKRGANPESQCLVVIDECGNYFPSDESSSPIQKLWKLFLRQHRKMGYDFALISQGMDDINRTIKGLVEYEINHRKANRVAPFKWLPWTLFFYVTYWRSDRKRQLIGSESSIYVKRFAALYDTSMMFGGFDEKMDFDFESLKTAFRFEFGNTLIEMEAFVNDGYEEIPEPVRPEQKLLHEPKEQGCPCELCQEYRKKHHESINNSDIARTS